MSLFPKKPHLFTNGEFSIKYSIFSEPMPINSFRNGMIGSWDSLGKEMEWLEIDDCTLIARPILDMTESEINEFVHLSSASDIGLLAYPEEAKTAVAMRMGTEKLSYSEFEFLNDNGFYHGSQFHFDDGTVIDKNKL